MQLSYWERDAMLDADFVVIGGGIIGLQTAIELRERRPSDRVVLLERGLLPAGASSRNAGFACFGSLTEILHDIDAMGEAATLAMVERRWRGLGLLRRRLGDEAMAYEPLGGYELLLDRHLGALLRLDEVNQLLRPLFGKDVFSIDIAGLRAGGFAQKVRVLIRNPFEGQLHSGRLMRALANLAAQRGVEIHTGAKVQALEEGDGGVAVRVAGADAMDALMFRAARVAVCTNGITCELLQQSGIAPARGQVLMTAPVTGLPWRGTYHLDEGFYYFRNVGKRVLLGGGRNIDFEGEACTEMVPTDAIQSALERLLHETILPTRAFHIDHRWAGVMGFAPDRQPVVRRLSERIVLGFGCNGMGVALSAEIAAETAAILM
jgi:glycine/D-amino acid oxidase-like deaminating enzyme